MSSSAETPLLSHSLRNGEAFTFRDGHSLRDLHLTYQMVGQLNQAKDNAVLLFHALSGTPHLAGRNRGGPPIKAAHSYWTEECHHGWWDAFVGPGKAIDTDQFCVICANYLGGCYGSSGPVSINPETGQAYGASFPHVSAADIVDSQIDLLDVLGIKTLHAVIGPSIGGLLALTIATLYPHRVRTIVSIGSGLEVNILQKLLIFEQALAIENDPNFRGGDYYGGEHPHRGLALARMISHKTFISLATLEKRARREVRQFGDQLQWYRSISPADSYILHQGLKFTQRFDANSYLRILEIWHSYDPFRDRGVTSSTELFQVCKEQQWLIFSIDSDVCFYPDDQERLGRALRSASVPSMHITVHSEKGHDSFLLEPGLYTPHLQYALQGGLEEHHG